MSVSPDLLIAAVRDGQWSILAIVASPSIAAFLWVAYRWHCDRRDKAKTSELSAEDREAIRLEQVRQNLSVEQTQLFTIVSGENSRLRVENEDLRTSEKRIRAFARLCEVRMHELYHRLIGARTFVDIDREMRGIERHVWPIEAPLPTDQDVHS